ncbi:MAG TPA: SDR family NAD(P)-dependent oxidoreductase [Acidimicrobiales bacterium]|nr:SDR family NAD(P)-dependent oxidoreductase [Acidimicrobiales bacterium]
MADLDGTTVVITGASSGIGAATARALAARGAEVLLACRSESRAAPVLDELAAAGTPALGVVPIDLGDLDAVRSAADVIAKRLPRFDVLINNAGVGGARGLTASGFELNFGTNHLGHFLLTTRLLDALGDGAPRRVVTVASKSHYQAKGIDFDAVRRPTRSKTGMPEYAVSKLANVVFSQELGRRVAERGIHTYVLHPGVIASDIWRNVPWPLRPVMTRFMKSPEQGACTSVYCATSPEIADDTGRYYTDCAAKEPNAAVTPELAAELWSRSEEWVAA